METHIAIIMGSAVLPDGRPSKAMQRRVRAALDLRFEFRNLTFLPTGGNIQRWGRRESDVMAELLKNAGVDDENIIQESESKDTLQSISFCAQTLKKLPDLSTVVVCSDSFHLPRCRLLLYILGISSVRRPMPGGKKSLGFIRWACYCMREAVAIPVDAVLLLIKRVQIHSCQ